VRSQELRLPDAVRLEMRIPNSEARNEMKLEGESCTCLTGVLGPGMGRHNNASWHESSDSNNQSKDFTLSQTHQTDYMKLLAQIFIKPFSHIHQTIFNTNQK
jgi:hypothetical protein